MQLEVVKTITVAPAKPQPKMEDPAKAWYPMGTVAPLNFDEAIETLYSAHPRARDWSRMIDRKGVGTHRFRHFRSYTLLIEQPTAGKFRGAGEKPEDRVHGRDGLVSLTVTTGAENFKRSKTFTVRVERRYVEGGDLDV